MRNPGLICAVDELTDSSDTLRTVYAVLAEEAVGMALLRGNVSRSVPLNVGHQVHAHQNLDSGINLNIKHPNDWSVIPVVTDLDRGAARGNGGELDVLAAVADEYPAGRRCDVDYRGIRADGKKAGACGDLGAMEADGHPILTGHRTHDGAVFRGKCVIVVADGIHIRKSPV